MSFNKICVLHLNQIGDLTFALPILLALRENYPDATIHSVLKPYLVELIAHSPYVDAVLPRKSDFKSRLKLIGNIRKNKYDLLISLATSEESMVLSSLSGAKLRIGFAHFPWDFSLHKKEVLKGHNSSYNNFRLLKRLNINIEKQNYVGLLHIDKIDKEEIPPDLPEKFAVISPGASRKRQIKTWPAQKFAELIHLLKQEQGLTSILVGSADNCEINETIIQSLKKMKPYDDRTVLNFTGKTNLKELCLVIERAKLFAGIDSGIMHLASAIDIPVVGLFGPTDPEYVGPQNSNSIVVRETDMDCVPCYLAKCGHADCMKRLSVEKVYHACKKLL